MRLGFLALVCLVGAAPAFADEAVRTGAAAFGDCAAVGDAPTGGERRAFWLCTVTGADRT